MTTTSFRPGLVLASMALVTMGVTFGCGDETESDPDSPGSERTCNIPPGNACIEFAKTVDNSAAKTGCEASGATYDNTASCSDLHGGESLAGTCVKSDPTLGEYSTYWYDLDLHSCLTAESSCTSDDGTWTAEPGCQGGSGGAGGAGASGGAGG